MKKTSAKLRAKHKAAIRASRPAHKRILLHPAAVFILLCTGVLLFGWTLKTAADSYSVKGKVPAPPLTEPAIITTPAAGSHFKTRPINISGTCPYQSYINLYRNGTFSGTTLCQPDGSFSLQSDLEPGANDLQAHVFNITDDEGPLSGPVTIYYDPPVLTSTPSSGLQTTQSAVNYRPFIISSDFKYVGYVVRQPVSWKIVITGGEGPYALNVKWGDGSESNYVQKAAGQFVVEHSYDQPGQYTVNIQGVDYRGYQAYLQLTAVVVKDKDAAASGTIGSGTRPSGILRIRTINILSWLWPAYSILLLMVISFWLGERQEYYALLNKRRHRHAK